MCQKKHYFSEIKKRTYPDDQLYFWPLLGQMTLAVIFFFFFFFFFKNSLQHQTQHDDIPEGTELKRTQLHL